MSAERVIANLLRIAREDLEGARLSYLTLAETRVPFFASALFSGRPLRVTRPLHFFRADGPMPEELELPLPLPAELGPAAEVVAELRDRVRAVELERAAERARTGRRVLGRRAVGADRGAPTRSRLRDRVRDCPRSMEKRHTRRVPARNLLAPTVRVGASRRDMTRPGR